MTYLRPNIPLFTLHINGVHAERNRDSQSRFKTYDSTICHLSTNIIIE